MRLAGFGAGSPKATNPGRAFAGTVESVGNAVNGFAVGDAVFGTCAGSFAEYARVKPATLAAMPSNLSLEQAAAVPISATTALQAIRDRANVRPGQRVLVVGASGGVGSYAVQIAKAYGAEVSGVCSTGKVEFVRELGADHVIDYSRDDVANGRCHYDVILDIGGNRRLSDLRRALVPNGKLVIIGGETAGRVLGGFGRSLRSVLLSPLVSQTLTMLVSSEAAAALEVVRNLVEANSVVPAIDRTYTLRDVPAAIRYVHEGHARGKVAISL